MHPVVSIIILTCNQLRYTKECIGSIRKYTKYPYELIVVDNGSTDGSVEWLRDQADIFLIENSKNRGFAAGCNQGLKASGGDYLLLLNNDVVVTEGWLSRLVACYELDPKTGLVGPMAHVISGPQNVEKVDYRNMIEMQKFAKAYRYENLGSRMVGLHRIVGFCMLFSREVYLKVGGLDESFEVGNFEDDDFCLSVLSAGYKIVVAKDVFIHHYGGKTFEGLKVDYGQVSEANLARFREKWAGTEIYELWGLSEFYVDYVEKKGGDQDVEKDEKDA